MSNWVLNFLTMHGDVDIISRIVETHFKIEPLDENLVRQEAICHFPGLIDDPDDYNIGYGITMGTTTEDGSRRPHAPWDGTIASPFYVFWYSRCGASGHVPLTLLSLYPSVELDYTWVDYDSGHPDGIGQRCKSENGLLMIVGEMRMVIESVSASELMWEDGRVFVPSPVECKWHKNDDGTPCRPDQYCGFWIYQEDLRYIHPDDIGEGFTAYLEKDSFYDESKWSVSLFERSGHGIVGENILASDQGAEEPGGILSKLRDRTAKRISDDNALIDDTQRIGVPEQDD
jgi:hypothetical protein